MYEVFLLDKPSAKRIVGTRKEALQIVGGYARLGIGASYKRLG